MSKENAMPLERIFGSKTRSKLLVLFFMNSQKSFYVREITNLIGEQINSVRRELANLEAVGLVKNEAYDNKVYYSANMKHPFARPFMEMFSKKIEVDGKKIPVAKNTWEDYARIVKRELRAVVETNRLPGQEGIDLLIVGDNRDRKLSRWAEVIEKKKGKALQYLILSEEEFEYRRSVRDRQVVSVMEMELIEVFDPYKIIKGEKKNVRNV